ncbi:NACHT, LRR and PYD domains-containing protein 3-like isoform X2 [Salarias fasciatus]|uniref:NACHT, LRR and PYD domains-containing protein 3-like n=1 Tax=Salarias fasciatus TaxID=181472 RepID=A0A672HUM3_SALFA|nr:NACHT, LRR and PYD domains-containing protein 3-like isoform X2 [Salarias fasciatus]
MDLQPFFVRKRFHPCFPFSLPSLISQRLSCSEPVPAPDPSPQHELDRSPDLDSSPTSLQEPKAGPEPRSGSESGNQHKAEPVVEEPGPSAEQKADGTTDRADRQLSRKPSRTETDGALKLWLLDSLQDLGAEQLKHFQWLLQNADEAEDGFRAIRKCHLETADRLDTVDLMVEMYNTDVREVTEKVLKKMSRSEGKCLAHVPHPEEVRWSAGVFTCRHKLKSILKQRFQSVFEGIAKAGKSTPLNQIYTELHITEGGAAEVNEQHEVRQIETASRRTDGAETSIRAEDIFKSSPGRSQPIRTVLTKGVAGIGKTVLTQKFTLDWAEDEANQDVHFTFPFTFRELNLVGKQLSLVGLVHHFFTETKEAGLCSFQDFQVVFILDGLDECRLPLDFHRAELLTDVTESSSVDVLLINLIRGKLLPSARLWITTRPAAANQIPADCVDRVTEVRGFTDPQKEEYFRRRFREEEQASRIISHIKTSRSLHIMCHIPVFCWISATVLEKVLKSREGGELPKTLTQMYIHHLVVQAKVKNVKFDGGAATDDHWSPESREMIWSLGKLAFEQLQKGNLIFFESDLTGSGIDLRAASMYSGVFTQVFREESGLYQDKVFCFVHLSLQEFLAALHVHQTFVSSGVNLLENNLKESEELRIDSSWFYQGAVDEALKSPNGHLDLFLRFLLGLSLPANQKLLRGLLAEIGGSAPASQEVLYIYLLHNVAVVNNNSRRMLAVEGHIRRRLDENLSADKIVNLFHCLNELNDHSLVEEIQQSLRLGRLSREVLSPAQWSALVFILLSSDQDLKEFNLKKYSASEEALLKLLPVVKASSKALLRNCDLSRRSCGALSSVLSSQSSSLTQLDLSNNNLQDSGVELLCDGLRSPLCKLEALRLSNCSLSERSCGALSSVLSSQSSSLTHLDLSDNDLRDSGVELLSRVLKSPGCKLEALSLAGCLVSEGGCSPLVSAVRSKSSRLRELDLSYNHPGDAAVDLLSAAVEDPDCGLDAVRVEPAGVRWLKPGVRKYSCPLSIDTNTVSARLGVSDGGRTVTHVGKRQSYPEHPDRFERCPQLLCETALTRRHYWEVEQSGDVLLALAYRGVGRRGAGMGCRFGENDRSWCLYGYDHRFSAWHDNRQTLVPSSPCSCSSSSSHRLGVYVDCPAGTLSFYIVCSDSLLHLYTFNTSFSEPLYAGFGCGSRSSLSLCEL